MSSPFNLHPFDNIGIYMQALLIISKVYNEKKQNFIDLAISIKHILKLESNTSDIIKFVQLVIQYPTKFGFTFITNYEDYNKQLISTLLAADQTTLTITPQLNKCHKCPNSVLIVKNPPLTKQAVLYTTSGSGKFFLCGFFQLLL